MKTLSQYREDIKNLMKKAADIDAQATNENRDLNDSEILLKNEILDTVEDLSKTVKTMERQDRVSKVLEGSDGPESVPKNKKVEQPGKDRERFSSLGQQMVSIIEAGRPGGRVDPRLYNAASGLNETVPSEGGLI
jgi:hypothetical protein